MDIAIISSLLGVILAALFVGGMSMVMTQQQEVKVIERFGKFRRTTRAGLSFKTPFLERVAVAMNLRLKQADVTVQAKTKDNVFVGVALSVQYQVVPEKASDAFYKLQSAEKQIESFVFNVVRSEIPKLTLEETFLNQDHIADAVDKQLAAVMSGFGYSIFKVLVTQIAPAAAVVTAMNEVKASEQLKQAATNKAEATKVTLVKQAEAEAEAKKLQGQGIAAERQAIVDGLQASVKELAIATGQNAADAMTILLLTQYLDTLKAIGTSDNVHTILLPHSPGGMTDLMAQIRDAIIVGTKATGK